MTTNREISFNIRQKIGVLAVYQSGWRKEVNLVEWNGGPAKVDIRDWDPKHEHMGKGVTLKPEEAEKLQWTLYRYFRGNGSGLLKEREEDLRTPVSADQDFPEPFEAPEPECGLDVPEGGDLEEGAEEQASLFSSMDCMLDVEQPAEEALPESEAQNG